MASAARFANGSHSKRSVCVSVARSVGFTPLDLQSEAPTNFAIHLQTRGEEPVHVITEGLAVVDESGDFPTSIWPAVVELCRRLSGCEIHDPEIWQSCAIQDAAKALEQNGDVKLAQSLRAAQEQRAANGLFGKFLRLPSSRERRLRHACEDALRAVLATYAAALQKMAAAVAAPGARSTNVLEHYAKRLDLISHSCCFPESPHPQFEGRLANIYPDNSFLQNHTRDATKGHLLEREALGCGLSELRLPFGSFIATDRHGKRLSFRWSRSQVSSGVSLAICTHKEATRIKLQRYGLPVPRGRVFAKLDVEQIATYAARIGYPVVCKPVAGRRGMGVVAGIRNEDELKKALALFRTSPYGQDDLIIEQHVRGEDYRIVVVGDEVVTAVRRLPASIVGNGVHTVADLILSKNALRLRNPHLRKVPIKFDDAARYQLELAGLQLDSVPEEGRWIQLANSNNISRGGDSVEVLDELHPSIRDAAIRALKAIPGLGFVGLDFLLEDHTKPLDTQTAAIIELNAHGAIGTGQYPMWGPPRNVARKFLLYCAEKEGVEVHNSPAASLSVKLKIRGRVIGVGYRTWFAQIAREFGLAGWIRKLNRTTVEAELAGDTAPVAALVNAAVRGPDTAVPYWVAVRHVTPEHYSDFEIRE